MKDAFRIKAAVSISAYPRGILRAWRHYIDKGRLGTVAYEDKVLNCRECGKDFVFTAGEQEFYAQRGFENQPTRCPECRKNRKMQASGQIPRQLYDATCSQCGAPCKVPFQPSGEKPVYCSECFAAYRSNRQ